MGTIAAKTKFGVSVCMYLSLLKFYLLKLLRGECLNDIDDIEFWFVRILKFIYSEKTTICFWAYQVTSDKIEWFLSIVFGLPYMYVLNLNS